MTYHFQGEDPMNYSIDVPRQQLLFVIIVADIGAIEPKKKIKTFVSSIASVMKVIFIQR